MIGITILTAPEMSATSNLLSASEYRATLQGCFATWREEARMTASRTGSPPNLSCPDALQTPQSIEV